MKRLPFVLCALLFVVSMAAPRAQAQTERPAQTFFIRPNVGIASYVGDNDLSLFNFDTFPYSAGLELGYQFAPTFSLGVAYQLGNYPGILASGDEDLRHSAQLLLRYTFRPAGVSPYLQAGGHVTFGEVDKLSTGGTALPAASETSFGPLLGLGLDVPLSGQVSLFLEANAMATFPDDAVDGREDIEFGGFDLLNTMTAGLKINFKRALVPVEVLSIDGPARLETNETGTFSATVNEQATRPLTYRWEWGDGATATGLVATHRYTRAGTYTVQFTASNRGSSDVETLTVTVEEPPAPARIVSMTADPLNPDTRTAVRFDANVRGDAPIRYAWDFGDGETGTGMSPTHTYRRPGTYTAQLTATNDAGSDTRSLTVTVQPYLAEICQDVTEMNSVFFNRNSSTLTDEARRTLQENLDILLECPNLSARVEGIAAPGERNPQRLSEDRARVVEQFYVENGVAISRLRSTGRGIITGMTSKKDGAQQYQRTDTIPVR